MEYFLTPSCHLLPTLYYLNNKAKWKNESAIHMDEVNNCSLKDFIQLMLASVTMSKLQRPSTQKSLSHSQPNEDQVRLCHIVTCDFKCILFCGP